MMWRTNNYYVLVRLIYHAYSNGVADIIDMCKTHIIKRRSHKTILFEKAPCKSKHRLTTCKIQMCKTSGMNCGWQLLEIPLRQTSIMVDDTGNNLAVGRSFGVYPLLWEYRCINQTVWIVSNSFWKYLCDNKHYGWWLGGNAIELWQQNGTCYGFELFRWVEPQVERWQTGSIVAGGATLECCRCCVKPTWKWCCVKWDFLYKSSIEWSDW